MRKVVNEQKRLGMTEPFYEKMSNKRNSENSVSDSIFLSLFVISIDVSISKKSNVSQPYIFTFYLMHRVPQAGNLPAKNQQNQETSSVEANQEVVGKKGEAAPVKENPNNPENYNNRSFF